MPFQSSGVPKPYRHETLATISTSSRSSSIDVACSRSRSMSSLMLASLAMYVFVDGT